MAFTDNCDLYVSVHEDGVNRVINHIRRQRPSLFNYASADVASNKELWCAKVEYTSDVTNHGNPLFTISPPVPVLGADSPPVVLGFCAQLTKAEIDFHPGNVIALPAELNPPLKQQHFAIHLEVCGGIVCPSENEINHIPPGGIPQREHGQTLPPIIPRGRLNCFCLEVFVIGHFEYAAQYLMGRVDDMDIVEIKPDKLEDNIICYVKTAVSVILREKLVVTVQALSLNFSLFNLASITISPSPNPPIPHNPAIEEDQLKAFIDVTVI